MSDPSRFTPLYVIQMMLDIKYGKNSNMIMPEALLEHSLTFEEDLLEDLETIDAIAESGDSEKIIGYVNETKRLMKTQCTFNRYTELYGSLFRNFSNGCTGCADLKSFMQRVRIPNIINHDFVKDLLPTDDAVLSGNYVMIDVFDCIFRYILYIKTKHLCLFAEDHKIEFESSHVGEGLNKLIFNY